MPQGFNWRSLTINLIIGTAALITAWSFFNTLYRMENKEMTVIGKFTSSLLWPFSSSN